MRHSANQTACLLALILKRSELNRARVSAKTIKLLAKRKALRGSFLNELREELAEYSWVLCELEGGYGVERSTLLEAAKPVTAKRWLSEDLRRALRRGEKIDFVALEAEAFPDEDQPDGDE